MFRQSSCIPYSIHLFVVHTKQKKERYSCSSAKKIKLAPIVLMGKINTNISDTQDYILFSGIYYPNDPHLSEIIG
jgi:hypothetical protein